MKTTGILISIRPEWCEKIISGEKKTELRTTAPTLPSPFKTYIYCTLPRNQKDELWITRKEREGAIEDRQYGNDYIIGEFVCDNVGEFELLDNSNLRDWHCSGADLSCVAYEDAAEYIKKKGEGYAWHISDLVIYDKPKELTELGVNRAPQSWQYITV